MNLSAYLRLIRWPNLAIMALILIVLRYAFLKALGCEVYLSDAWHALLVIATVLVAAGGNVINDAFDVVADGVNKPTKRVVGKQISKETAKFIGQILLIINNAGKVNWI